MASRALEQKYPLHWLVWHNKFEDLDRELSKELHDIEKQDPRKRTCLHLAVTLGHLESVRVLLRYMANANAENAGYWTVLQEAVSTGDPEIVQAILKHRDFQRYTKRTAGVPELLQKLKESPDFYVEMKWEFASWIPLVSRMCPSDTYKVWKSGSNVRIDTTLLGFDNMNWQRGSRSYVFQGVDDTATVMEIDHDRQEIFSETIRVLPTPSDISFMQPSDDAVAARLTSPVVTTYLDTDKIAFERNKSGIWGWRSDKSEKVNEYECKVFSASNVELVTKTRTEHLTEQDKIKTKKKNSRTPLESFLGAAEEQNIKQGATNGEVTSISYNPASITPEEYFNSDVDLCGKDIGRPVELTTKIQKFKATLWLCETFPLSLQEQVVPIIDLMAASNAHFKKLRDFITLQIPSGFPVKIEIPLFHVLNARITFGNIYGSDSSVKGVNLINGSTPSCTIRDGIFSPPAGYSLQGDSHHERLRDEDDELLQFAIQQSLVEAGTEDDKVTFWEALNKSKPPVAHNTNSTNRIRQEEERLLQQAIAESIMLSSGRDAEDVITQPVERGFVNIRDDEDQMRLVLELSQKQQNEESLQRQQEDEELEKILKLSLIEK